MIGATPGSGAASATRASLPRRIASVAYEALLLGAVLLGAGFVLAPLVSPATPAPSTGSLPLPTVPARALLFGALFTICGLYFCWSWTGGRRTLPMKTWRIGLARRDGGRLDPRSALIRYGATWIGPVVALVAYLLLRPTGHAGYALWLLGLNYAWAGVDPDRQFLHDRIAGTRIIADP